MDEQPNATGGNISLHPKGDDNGTPQTQIGRLAKANNAPGHFPQRRTTNPRTNVRDTNLAERSNSYIARHHSNHRGRGQETHWKDKPRETSERIHNGGYTIRGASTIRSEPKNAAITSTKQWTIAAKPEERANQPSSNCRNQDSRPHKNRKQQLGPKKKKSQETQIKIQGEG